MHGRCGRVLRACTEPGKKNPACCAAPPARMSVPQSPQDCGSAGARATGGLGKRPGPCQARRDSALAGRERGRCAGAAHQKSSLAAISTRNHREKTNFVRGVSPREVSHSALASVHPPQDHLRNSCPRYRASSRRLDACYVSPRVPPPRVCECAPQPARCSRASFVQACRVCIVGGGKPMVPGEGVRVAKPG